MVVARPVRVAELMAMVSSATDFAKGLPEEQALRTCRIAMRLAELDRADAETSRDVFYVCLLRFVGCTATAPEMAAALGDEIAVSALFTAVDPRDLRAVLSAAAALTATERRRRRRVVDLVRFMAAAPAVIREHEVASCEVGRAFATRVGLPGSTATALGQVFERWDGHGHPGRARGADIHLAARIGQVANLVEMLVRTVGPTAARAALRSRGGGQIGPRLAELAADHLDDLAGDVSTGVDLAALLDREAAPWLMVTGDALDTAVAAIGAVADLKSRFSRGHAAGVAACAQAAGLAAGLPPEDVARLRRAGFLHDIGRLAVSSAVWDKPSALTGAEWEQVRLHPYVTERVLARCAPLAGVAELAGAHHERCDGSGYHRGTRDPGLPAQLLAAADVYQAAGEPRAHRPALDVEQRAALLGAECAAGRLGRAAVNAVLAGAGAARVPATDDDSPLTARERQVLTLVARGATNRDVAAALGISAKTVNAHLEHVFAKLDVTTRGAAIYIAVDRGLIGGAGP